MANNNNEFGTRPLIKTNADEKHFQDEMIRESLKIVYEALCEKGYDPVAQIIGFLMSGDPTYITAHNNARIIACRLDRDEMMRVIIRDFFQETSR